MKKSPTISIEEWIKETFTSLPERPPGSIVIEDVMKHKNLSRSNTTNKMNELVRQGKLRKGTFVENGKMRNYYIPIQSE